MRPALALLFLAHGIAHLVGFLGPFRLSAQVPYRSTVLGGRVDLGDTGIRTVGVVWLGLALAYAAVATATALDRPGWPTWALVVTAVSTLLCILALPDTRVGLVVNLALLGLLMWLQARPAAT